MLSLLLALLERVLQAVGNRRIAWLAKSVEFRMPIDIVIAFAMAFVVAEVLPIFREHETTSHQEVEGLVLERIVCVVVPSELANHARKVPTMRGPEAGNGFAAGITCDR